jgi:hypothetical protein
MSEPRQGTELFSTAPDWTRRGSAFLRFLAFAALSGAFAFGIALVGSWALALSPVAAPRPEADIAMPETALALGILGATALMARIGRRPWRDFGLGGSDRARNFLIGIAVGLVSVSLLLLAMRLASVYSLGPATAIGGAAAVHGLFYALVMLCVAFAEEMLFRGYGLAALSESLSFWPATLASSTVFGLMHGSNTGESVAGLVSAALCGVVLACSFRYTRSLWFAIGFHAAWDYAESFIFGVPNSGLTLPGSLFHAQFDGPSWLTGGSAGPEGSVLILVVFGTLLLVIRKFLRRSTVPEDGRVIVRAASP